MRAKWRWPAWAGAAGGVVAAVLLSVGLRVGTITLRRGLSLNDRGDISEGIALLLLTGVVFAAVVGLPRLHPLLPGIPAVWFGILYLPALFIPWPGGWMPEWMMSHFLATAMPAPFVLTGLLLAATVMSLLGWWPRFGTEETREEAASM